MSRTSSSMRRVCSQRLYVQAFHILHLSPKVSPFLSVLTYGNILIYDSEDISSQLCTTDEIHPKSPITPTKRVPLIYPHTWFSSVINRHIFNTSTIQVYSPYLVHHRGPRLGDAHSCNCSHITMYQDTYVNSNYNPQPMSTRPLLFSLSFHLTLLGL